MSQGEKKLLISINLDFIQTVTIRKLYAGLCRLCLTTVVTVFVFSTLAFASSKKPSYSIENLNALKTELDPYVEDGRLPNYLLSVYHKGKLIFEAQKGHTDIALEKPIQRDTIFWIASMTKPVTSVAALQLVEQGKLSLDAPLSDYLPEFADMLVAPAGKMDSDIVAAGSPILVKHLFTHTSGLSYGEAIVGPSDVSKMYDELDTFSSFNRRFSLGILNAESTTSSIMSTLSSIPLRAQPGTEYNYSMGTDVLGALVEKISGMKLGDYMDEHIFRPLGMLDTGFEIPNDKTHRVAALFTANRTTVQLPGQTKNYVPFEKQNFCKSELNHHSGGTGLCSTADDFSKFLSALMNGGKFGDKQILKPETVQLLLENQLPPKLGKDPLVKSFGPAGKDIYFSLGLGIATDKARNPRYYWWAGAANTFFWFDPRTQLSGVFMTHHFPVVYMLIEKLYAQTAAAKL